MQPVPPEHLGKPFVFLAAEQDEHPSQGGWQAAGQDSCSAGKLLQVQASDHAAGQGNSSLGRASCLRGSEPPDPAACSFA